MDIALSHITPSGLNDLQRSLFVIYSYALIRLNIAKNKNDVNDAGGWSLFIDTLRTRFPADITTIEKAMGAKQC